MKKLRYPKVLILHKYYASMIFYEKFLSIFL